MTIGRTYFGYLDHFGKTVTLSDLHGQRDCRSLIALRHDVDHDLDLALEMSYRECERGCRASYYLLHTAKYWDDPRRIEKALQIQDFGHEVGLHVNLLTQWYRGEIDDVDAALASLVGEFREAGVRISGVSAHGDRCCYEAQFINYWCFAEFRPGDPLRDESGRTAEGIPVGNPGHDRARRIDYPPGGKLTRPDGRSFDFWSVSLREYDLEYDAWHVPHDLYFSDSGGRWTRTPDPRDVVLDGKRVMVLMHPVYYRGPRRYYFFFSSPGGGAEAVADFLDAATPLWADHQRTLGRISEPDHRQRERRREARHDPPGTNRSAVRKALIETRLWLDEQSWDYAETSAAPEAFREEFDELFADAVKVHLARRPQDIVADIFGKGWYAPHDAEERPRPAVSGWKHLSPFEKCCWSARLSLEALADWCDHRLKFETVAASGAELQCRLEDLEIPLYPRLASAAHIQAAGRGSSPATRSCDEWSPEMQRQFEQICGPIVDRLGYSTTRSPEANDEDHGEPGVERPVGDAAEPASGSSGAETVFETKLRVLPALRYPHVHCRLQRIPDGVEMVRNDERKHAHVLFAGASWHKLAHLWRRGWTPRRASYYRLTIDAITSEGGHAELYCLNYDRQGALTGQRLIGRIDDTDRSHSFSFHPRCDAWRFSVALHVTTNSSTRWVRLHWLRLEALPMRPPV